MGGAFGELRGRTLGVVVGCLACQLGLGFGYVYSTLLKVITEDLELSRAAFASARVPLLFAMAAVSPLLGWLVVRVGARPVLAGASLMILPTFFWLSRAESLWHFYVGNVMLGLLTTGLGDITVGAVVSQWLTRARGLALGLVYTGSNLGAIVFVQIATLLAIEGSWRDSFLAVGVLGAVVILPFALFVVRDRHPGESRAEEPFPGAGPEADGGPPDLTAREALRTRSFWILFVALFSFFLYFLAILEHLVAALSDAGLSHEAAAGWYSLAIGMGLVSKVAMGLLADRVTPRLAFLADFGLLSLSSLLLLAVPRPGFLQSFVVIFGFAYAARDVVYPLVIADCFGVRYLPTIYGLLMVVLAPAGSLGGILAGWSFDRLGSYDVAFQGFAALNLVVFASLFWLRREKGPA
ncbi:MAG: MFS transporter [Myxococcota bacterium]|nr:MFS transporter [Myxococcota bacterium]